MLASLAADVGQLRLQPRHLARARALGLSWALAALALARVVALADLVGTEEGVHQRRRQPQLGRRRPHAARRAIVLILQLRHTGGEQGVGWGTALHMGGPARAGGEVGEEKDRGSGLPSLSRVQPAGAHPAKAALGLGARLR